MAQRFEDCNLDFHRTMFLGDMCWKFGQYLENTETNRTKTRHDIAKLVDDGTEIGMRQAVRKLRFLDDLDHQASVLQTMAEAAEDAYFELTGRAYVRPARRDVPGVSVDMARVKMIRDSLRPQAPTPPVPPTAA